MPPLNVKAVLLLPGDNVAITPLLPLVPKVNVPAALVPKLIALATVSDEVVLSCRVAEPPAESPRVVAPLPAPLALLRMTVPFLTATPPPKVLVPLRVSVPVPVFANDN